MHADIAERSFSAQGSIIFRLLQDQQLRVEGDKEHLPVATLLPSHLPLDLKCVSS